MVRPDSGQARPTCSANQAGGVAGSQSDLRPGGQARSNNSFLLLFYFQVENLGAVHYIYWD